MEFSVIIPNWNGKNELDADVLFAGFVPDEDLPAIYKGADLFVYLSKCEGFGLPILEAMASGVPVVCSDRASLPGIVADAAVLVNPDNIDKVADAVYEVLTSERLRVDLKEKGIERAKLFSWDKTAQQTLEIYRQVFQK